MDFAAGASPSRRRWLLLACGLAVAAIAAVDWKLKPNVSLGYLYLLPIVVLALLSTRLQLALVAVGCAVLREAFSPTAWDADAIPRLLLVSTAFVGVGLFVSELARNHLMAVEHARRIGEEVRLRRDLEAELRVLVESSPAGIITADAQGKLLLANEAARRLLAIGAGDISTHEIASFLPALGSVLDGIHAHTAFRANLECIGRTAHGGAFLAQVWFSTYEAAVGRRLAAIVLDASEDLRDRETGGLSAIVAASRVVFGAVSHEVRNLAAAASLSHSNLARLDGLEDNADFRALGTLVQALERLASSGLSLSAERASGSVALGAVLDELRVVLGPLAEEADIRVRWDVSDALPRIRGDHHGLLQVFLNLAQNSLRELAEASERVLTLRVASEGHKVLVQLLDSGPGVSRPEALFQPFQEGSDATGLGLYVSRAIARSFGGDLRWEPTPEGSCFTVELLLAGDG